MKSLHSRASVFLLFVVSATSLAIALGADPSPPPPPPPFLQCDVSNCVLVGSSQGGETVDEDAASASPPPPSRRRGLRIAGAIDDLDPLGAEERELEITLRCLAACIEEVNARSLTEACSQCWLCCMLSLMHGSVVG